MRVVVTGATGFVGRLLSKKLVSKGHELVVVGRSSEERFRKSFTLPCEYQNWDKLKFENIDAVYHLAGEGIASGRWTEQKKKSILKSRTETTQKLASAFKGHWPSIYVGASAIGYYGDRGDEILTEESKPGNGFLTDVCVAWENSHRVFEAHSRTVVLRIGLVLDRNQGFLEPMEKLFSFRLGGQVSDGQQVMSWIHADDLVRIMLHALENHIQGVFNAVAPQPVSNKEFTELFSNQLGVGAYFPAPAFMLKLVLGEMSALALNSQRVSSNKIESEGFKFESETLKKALSEIYK